MKAISGKDLRAISGRLRAISGKARLYIAGYSL
jgi:hypothetical protein